MNRWPVLSDGPKPSQQFNPVVPGLIGLAMALAWIAAFPALASLCAWASELIGGTTL